jgi:hypothetical protein
MTLHFVCFLIAFFIFATIILVVGLANLLFLEIDFINAYVETAYMFGNFIGFCLGFYILFSALRLKGKNDIRFILFVMGLVVVFLNGRYLFT